VSRGNQGVCRNKVLCIYEYITILKSKDHENKKENKEYKSIFDRIIIMKRNFISIGSNP
jgi:ABC-type tungstate transport system permease subunit